MKKLLYIALVCGLSTSVFSCRIDPYRESLDYFYVQFTNNSDSQVSLATMALSHPSKRNGAVDSVLLFGYMGFVERHSVSAHNDLPLWGVGPYKDKNYVWSSFFKELGIDSFQIIVAEKKSDLFLWYEHRNDSLILAKYTFTLSDLQNERNTVSIIYP